MLDYMLHYHDRTSHIYSACSHVASQESVNTKAVGFQRSTVAQQLSEASQYSTEFLLGTRTVPRNAFVVTIDSFFVLYRVLSCEGRGCGTERQGGGGE